MELFEAVAPFLREVQEGLPQAADVQPQLPLPQEGQAASPHSAPDLEEQVVLYTTPLKNQIKAEIETSVERSLRAYCDWPSVAKRFPKVNYPSLDYSALAKHLAQEELEVGSKSTKELLELFQMVQGVSGIKGLFNDLLRSLNEND